MGIVDDKVVISHPRGRIICDEIRQYDGSFPEGLNDYVIVGFRRSPFWKYGDVKVSTVLTIGHYSGILSIMGRYLRIRCGTRVLSLLRYLGRKGVYIDIIYPWNIYESIGGLLSVGLPMFRGIKGFIHVVSKDGESRLDIDHFKKSLLPGSILSDIHVMDGFDRVRTYSIYVKLSSSETEAVVKRLVGGGVKFSLLRDVGGFHLFTIVRQSEYRSVLEIVTKVIDKSRIIRSSMDDIDYTKMPNASSRMLYSDGISLGTCRDVDACIGSVRNIVFLSFPDLYVIGFADKIDMEVLREVG